MRTRSTGLAATESPGAVELADWSLWGLLDALAASTPTPGAGPAVAWTCALAAALVEMVSTCAKGDDTPALAAARRERACVLRLRALELAQTDITAYEAVVAARRQPAGPKRTGQVRDALAAAAEPPLAIAEVAAELALLAADAAEQARGGVRGEATTAAILADAAAAACPHMLHLNLGGHPRDPRLARGDRLAREAHEHRERATRTA